METIVTVKIKFYHEHDHLTKEEVINYLEDNLDECPDVERLNDTVTVSYEILNTLTK